MPVPNDPRLLARRTVARARLVRRLLEDLGPEMLVLVALNSARNSMNRHRGTKLRDGDLAVPRRPGSLQRVEALLRGGNFEFDNAHLEISFLRADLVRLSWGPGTEPVPYALSAPGETPVPQIALLRRPGGGWRLLSDVLEVEVTSAGETTIAARGGPLLRRSAPPVRFGEAWEQEFEMRSGECFSGLGEQAAGVDLRGGRHTVWNTDVGGAWGPGSGPLYMGIPVVVGSHPEGDVLTFFENSTRGTFAFDSSPEEPGRLPRARLRFEGGLLRSYVVAGSLPHLLYRYSELTGRPALPPRWALGHHQSRWGYKSASDVRYVLDGYRSGGLPLSAVHMDIDYMHGYRVFTFDRGRFPDPKALSEEAGRNGVRLVTILDPGVKLKRGYHLYEGGAALGAFCRDPRGRDVEGVVWPGRAVFPDFTSERVRGWWGDQYRVLTAAGISGVWHDMNEPSSISLAGDPTLPLDTVHDLDGRGGDHREAHNLYGLLMNRAGFDALRRELPDRRPFIVSRSGWAANQRWAWNWTGDTRSTWDAMRQQVATLLGMGLSGIAFSGSDIGGFNGAPDEELYLRWLQMSVFVGFCRTHSIVGVPPREPWRFAEPTRSWISAWIRFRYRMLPYLYTLAYVASRTGAPLLRPMWWPPQDRSSAHAGEPLDENSNGSVLAQADDQFLLGDDLVVAPVFAEGALRRRLWLTAGRWWGMWEKDPGVVDLAGPGLVTRDAPVSRIPVMVRGGSVLPLDDGFADARGPLALESDPKAHDASGPVRLDHSPRLLSFHCFADHTGAATGHCYDDAGDGYGPSRIDELELTNAEAGSTATLSWRSVGDFPKPSRVRVVVHGFESPQVLRDGEALGPPDGGAVETTSFERLEFKDLVPRPTSHPAN